MGRKKGMSSGRLGSCERSRTRFRGSEREARFEAGLSGRDEHFRKSCALMPAPSL